MDTQLHITLHCQAIAREVKREHSKGRATTANGFFPMIRPESRFILFPLSSAISSKAGIEAYSLYGTLSL